MNQEGPWGSPNGSGKPSGNGNSSQPPRGPQRPDPNPRDMDMDALLRRGQERLRQTFSNGSGGGHGSPRWLGVRLIVLVFIGMWLASGFYQVSTNEVGVVLRFGKAVRTEQAGLHYHLPAPIEQVLQPDVTTTHQIKLGFRDRARVSGDADDVPTESRMLTGDENIVDIDFSVFWRVADPQSYLFSLRNPELTVNLVAESAIREVIGRNEIQSILTDKRDLIQRETADLIQSTLDEYGAGIKITQVELLNVSPPAPVVDAFNDVQRARADGERLRNEAEAYRNDILPRARGDATRILRESEGYREQSVSLAKGEAARFAAIQRAYAVNRDVIATRLYLETMEAVLHGANKVVLDPAANKGAVPYLPLQDFLRRPPAAAAPVGTP